MNIAEIPNEYPTDRELAQAMHDLNRPPEVLSVRLDSRDLGSGSARGVVTLAIPALKPDATISLPWRARWARGEPEPWLESREAGHRCVCDASIPLTSDVIAWVDVRQDLWAPHVMRCIRAALFVRSDS